MVEILTVDRRVLVVNPVTGSIRVEYFEPGEAKAIVDTGFIDLLIKAEVAAQLPAPPGGASADQGPAQGPSPGAAGPAVGAP